MSDVAQIAGVSHQTVSRVLNDHPAVRPQTRERVLAAISTLGYRRNSAARALVTKRSQTIGVISFDTTLFGPASTLYGIEEAAHEAGYYVSVATAKSITRDTVLDGFHRLVAQSVDGFIVIAPQREAFTAVAELPRDGVDAVGFGMPARVDQATGVVLGAVNLPTHDIDFRSEMTRRLGLPVGIENDANAAAYAEFRLGAGRDVQSLVMLTLGTGVGGAAVAIAVGRGLPVETGIAAAFAVAIAGGLAGLAVARRLDASRPSVVAAPPLELGPIGEPSR